jgi:hypothetical protein
MTTLLDISRQRTEEMEQEFNRIMLMPVYGEKGTDEHRVNRNYKRAVLATISDLIQKEKFNRDVLFYAAKIKANH